MSNGKEHVSDVVLGQILLVEGKMSKSSRDVRYPKRMKVHSDVLLPSQPLRRGRVR